MPSYYMYECYNCGYTGKRYRNTKKCPTCGRNLDRVGELRICYHGTDSKNAKIIKVQGFNPSTYFGRHLEDALFMGGEHIFEVAFKVREIPDNWQFRIKEKVMPDKIVRYYKLKKLGLYNNEHLAEAVLQSNLSV